MAKKLRASNGDPTPVTGGILVPNQLVATPVGDDAAPDDDLGRFAYWLLKLNPDKVSLKFRKTDLSNMDDETKRMLIADIQRAIGVAPFTSDTL